MSTAEKTDLYQLDNWTFKLGKKTLEIAHAADSKHKTVKLPLESLKVKCFQSRKLSVTMMSRLMYVVIACALMLVCTVLYRKAVVFGVLPQGSLPIWPIGILGLAVLGAAAIYLLLAIKDETSHLVIEGEGKEGRVSWSYSACKGNDKMQAISKKLAGHK